MKSIQRFQFFIDVPRDFSIGGFTGKVSQGALLTYLKEKNPNLWEKLHEGNHQRPYSIFPFTKISNGATIGVATTDEELSQTILRIIVEDDYGTIKLVRNEFPVYQVQFSKVNPVPAEPPEVGSGFALRFQTPAIFPDPNRKRKVDPFLNLQKLWYTTQKTYEMLTGEALDEDLPHRIEKQVAITNFELKSAKVSLTKTAKVFATMGYLKFVVEENDGLDHLNRLVQTMEHWGIGGKRAMGFGKVKVKYFRN